MTRVVTGALPLAPRRRGRSAASEWRIAADVVGGVVRSSLGGGNSRSGPLDAVWVELKRFGAANVRNIPLSRIRGIDDVRVSGPVLRHDALVLCALSVLLECERIFVFGAEQDETSQVLAESLPVVRIDRLVPPAPEPLRSAKPEATRITQLTGDPDTFDFSPYSGKIDLVHIESADPNGEIDARTDAAFSMISELGSIVWDDYPQSAATYAYLNELAPALDRPIFHVLGTRLALYSRWDIVRPDE